MRYSLVDMHCHLGFLADAPAFAQAAAERGMGFFSNTVTPGEFSRCSPLLEALPNVRIGAGLHPWWIDEERCGHDDVDAVCELVRITRFVGEVGLDFGKRHGGSRERQMAAFGRVARTCALEGGKLLSVHAVRSADVVLDVLEDTGCLRENEVIFHWFSGSNEALQRAIRAGCFFSVNARMLATGKGREYAKVIPVERLLLETDLPPETDGAFSLDAWEAELQGTLAQLETIRGETLGERIAATSASLLKAAPE